MTATPSRTSLRSRSRVAIVTVALAAVALGSLAACGADPFAIKWSISPDTVELYSLNRTEIGLPSGYNFYNRARITIESASATGQWDVALGTRNGALVLLPPLALGVPGTGRVATLSGTTFDDLTEAPADTTLYSSDAVPLTMGDVYVIRTNQSAGSFGAYCYYYAKLAPLDIDVENGVLRFVFDSSPVCNDRALIPKN